MVPSSRWSGRSLLKLNISLNISSSARATPNMDSESKRITTIHQIERDVMKTITTYWLDKSSLQGLHYKIVIYSNGVVISTTENDYSPGDFNDIPTAINPNMVLSQESITVPAGTFNCNKASITTTDLGNIYVTTVWGNSNVPVIGMVKQELASSGVLIKSTELVAYGG